MSACKRWLALALLSLSSLGYAALPPQWRAGNELTRLMHEKSLLASSNTAGSFHVVEVKSSLVSESICERIQDFDVSIVPVVNGEMLHKSKLQLTYRKDNNQCPGASHDYTPVLTVGETRYLRLSCQQKSCRPLSNQFFAHTDEQLSVLIDLAEKATLKNSPE